MNNFTKHTNTKKTKTELKRLPEKENNLAKRKKEKEKKELEHICRALNKIKKAEHKRGEIHAYLKRFDEGIIINWKKIIIRI